MIWNKGLTSKTSESVAKAQQHLKDYYKIHAGAWTGKKHTEETKAKISAARRKYLNEHPDKVLFKLNHSSKESFPEKYFRKWLKNEGLLEAQELQIDRYTLDFAWPDKKIYLEIDGNQHKQDWMQRHDKIRTDYLANLGWICIGRVDWAAFQQLNKRAKHLYLAEIKSAIVEARFIEKFISKQDKKQMIRDEWKAQGKVNSLGRAVGSMLSNDEWQRRLQLILNSNVDLTKFGWKEQVQKVTNLTRRQLNCTIKHFPEYFKDKYIRGK